MRSWCQILAAAVTLMFIFSCSTLERLRSGEAFSGKSRLSSLFFREENTEEEASEEAEEIAEAVEPKTARTAAAAKKAEAIQKDLSEIQQRLVEGAAELIGKHSIDLGGKQYNSDCSGTVRAIYAYAGIDLAAWFGRYTGNGVTRIYRTLEDEELLYETHYPEPGDLLFWDNTYDRNSDGLWNDELTHIGMVMESYRDGTIRYVHFHYGRNSVVVENMNLVTPNVYKKTIGGESVIVNAPMRMTERGVKYPINKGLTSHLFRIFGRGYLLESG
jgi:hypothetical protein